MQHVNVRLLPGLYWICLLILFGNCTKKKSVLVWNEDLPVIGSQSSPRAVDLNEDGVLDIVMGAGKNEYQPSEQGVVALDGKTGKILWQQDATDQVYGSATFYDVTGDGIADIFTFNNGAISGIRIFKGKMVNNQIAFDRLNFAFQDNILSYPLSSGFKVNL